MPSCLSGYFAAMLRQAAPATLVAFPACQLQPNCVVLPLADFLLPAQGKAPVFLKTGALSKGRSPSMISPAAFLTSDPEAERQGAKYQKSRPKISPLPGE